MEFPLLSVVECLIDGAARHECGLAACVKAVASACRKPDSGRFAGAPTTGVPEPFAMRRADPRRMVRVTYGVVISLA